MIILKSVTIYVIFVAMKPTASFNETCIGKFCFTTSDANDLRNFDGAKSWCTGINSALAVLNDSVTQLALTQFLKSSNINAMMFINIKLYQHNNTWFLVNGTNYNGNIYNQDVIAYQLYCYLQTNWNNFQVNALHPSEKNRYICEFQNSMCLNSSTNNTLYNGRCYVKYEHETLSWYKARETCVNNDGDLATIQNAQFKTSWLNPSWIYWIGVRWNGWSWKSPDGGSEAIYTSWSSVKPNNYYYQCVCVDPTGIPAWSWTDCSCDDQRQFVCLKIVPTTTISTTTTTTTTRAATINTTSELKRSPISATNALAIGLGAGLGGGIFIIVLVVLVVVVIVLVRKRRRTNKCVESQHTVENPPSTTTPNMELRTPDRSDVYAHVVPTTQHSTNNKSPNDVIYEKPDFSNNPNSASSGSNPTNTREGKVKSIMLEEYNDVYANAASVS